ncbi:hypothetical protein ACFPPD_18615 [Cohnella suwonensis]|uniref:Uncharacterized protein n=1 Tax=Cohnella suwonensis TaxID=696072 RepID=A0ABW0LY08_9BACL
MPNEMIYSSEFIDIRADNDKKQVHIELSTSGYRPKYVSLFVEDAAELDRIIAALQRAKSALA